MNRNHAVLRRLFRRVAPVVAVLAILTSAATAGVETGICIQAFIEESMVLPDGSVHPPGTLRICLARSYSPVAGLHKTLVDGRTIGLFVSRYRLSEGVSVDPRAKLVFRRIPDGSLALLGYAVPGRERTALYWMDPTDRSRRWARLDPAPSTLAALMETEPETTHLVPAITL